METIFIEHFSNTFNANYSATNFFKLQPFHINESSFAESNTLCFVGILINRSTVTTPFSFFTIR